MDVCNKADDSCVNPLVRANDEGLMLETLASFKYFYCGNLTSITSVWYQILGFHFSIDMASDTVSLETIPCVGKLIFCHNLISMEN